MKQLITKISAVLMVVCLLGFLSTTTVHAQVDVVYGWAKGYGTTISDYNTGIATDASGNVYTLGNFNGSITALGLTSNINNLDVVITKHNAAGILQWSKSIGGTGADIGLGIAVDGSGNVYITGQFKGTADFNPSAATANLTSPNGNNDTFLAKYDDSGNYLWAKGLGGTGDGAGFQIALDANNNVYLTGYFSSTADFDPSVGTANLTSTGSNDVFIAKYDANGNYAWAKAMGGTLADYGQGIALDTSNNVYITGTFQSTADFDPSASTTNLTSAGGQDIFMAKYNASGNYVWVKSIGGNATFGDSGNGIAVDASSNVYITGNFSGTVDFDPSAATANLPGDLSQNIFMAKYNANGNYVWAKAMGSDRNDIGSGIALDASSNVYLTGVFAGTVDFDPSAATANLISTGFKDYIFMAKYNASGNYVWAKSMGANSVYGASGNGIAVDASNNVYITGDFSVTVDFDPSAATANITAIGQSDLFIAKYSQSGLCTPTFTQVAAICSGASLSALPTISNNAVTGTWSPALNNAATTTYTFTPTAGSCDNTATMTITINPNITPSVTIAANPSNSITAGTSVIFTAAPTNGGTTPAYQWKKNGNNVGTNNVTYTDDALENGDIITCVLTSNNPCASPTTAISTGITMAVNYPCPAGTTWTSRTSAANNVWKAVTYGNGVFVAVASSGTGNRVMTSPDGINWTSRTSVSNYLWESITYGNGLFVAVAAYSGTGNDGVMTSPDGVTWISRTTVTNYEGWNSVTFGNGLFVAFHGGGRIMTSPDGITWVEVNASLPAVPWTSVTYGNGLFVAVANSNSSFNQVWISPDGINWTSQNAVVNNNWTSVTYGNGLFVAVAAYSGTGNRVMTSPDGIIWTSRTSAADNDWTSVTYGNGLFVAVAKTGSGNRLMISPDGINWTIRSSAANNNWASITYGKGVFVAVSENGTGNRVMTSSPALVTPSVTIAANPGNSITTGTAVTFTATPTNGGTTPTYQWKKNGNNVGSNSVTYTDAALLYGDIITCVLTSNDPCASPTTATSTGITMVVAAPTLSPPSISYSSPQSYTVGTLITPLTPVNTGGAVPATIFGQVSTFAGSYSYGSADGMGTEASFDLPSGVAADAAGNVYVADQGNYKIRKITASGMVTTLAGSGLEGATDGNPTSASFSQLNGIDVDVAGNVYVADRFNQKIRKITAAGVVSTFAGSGDYGSTDGPSASATFRFPHSVAVDAAGNVYVADGGSNKIRKITTAGIVTTLAGSGLSGATDGIGSAASFSTPTDLAVDTAGNVYVADIYNNKIRKITASGVVTTLAGSGVEGSTNGTGTAASFFYPNGVAVDAAGNVYVADVANHKIRKITPAGVVTTLAGSENYGSTDGSTGIASSFSSPTDVAVDALGNVYVADRGNHKIRKITTNGYSISPALPAGLSFDGATGTISGTPTTAVSATSYTVTAYNTSGSSSTNVSIAIVGLPPTITSFMPTTAASGVVVTISGTNLSDATAVNFGATAAASFTVVNATTITAIVGNGASGSVSVTTPSSTATLAGFTYCVSVTPTFTAVSAICSGTSLSALPTTSTNAITGTWSPALNNTATTTYTFTPTVGQCATTKTMTITVNPNVTPTFTSVAPICLGAILSALPTTSTNAITGTWSPALNNTATTTYTFTPTAGQCVTTQTMTIMVNPNVTPTFTQVAAICSGAGLSALPTTSTNAITGTWSPALNNIATTTYTFTPTAGQCATTKTMIITVNPNVTPTFAQVAAICSGASLSALPTTSTNAITGTWSPALNNTATTTYTFTPTVGQCATTKTMTITVNPNVTPAFTQVAAICSGAILSALPTTSTNAITGTWSPALNNTATTTYTFTPMAGQCATTKTMTIMVTPQPTQPTLACYESATFNTSSCAWDVTGTQPTQPTLACYESATFNTSSCAWEVTGTQPTQPTLACYESATFNTSSCTWEVTGTQPTQPTLACYESATFNTTSCAWEVTGTQPTQPTLACYESATFNTSSCTWEVTGTQPLQPTLACYESATFNTSSCAWDVTGTQPTQPTLACYESATFNTSSCAWDVSGTQPTQPTLACYESATFNTSSCAWEVTGTQPTQPTLACYESATFNTSSCAWDVTGTQPPQPTLACYESATFNTSSCTWDVTGTQPTQPTLACYESATFNTSSCAWDVSGTQPTQPTLACYESAAFNTSSCSWDITGTQPLQPTLACYESATFNTSSCAWDVTGTQPLQPTLACYESAAFNTSSCSWDITGTQPLQPTLACYESATFNTSSCAWEVTGTQPTQPTLACYESATFNTSSCAWEVTGTQPTQPTLACYESATFNTSSCTWDVTGTQPTQPTLACYESATFNTSSCAWEVTGTAPTVPTGNSTQTLSVAALADATIASLIVIPTNVIWYASLVDAQTGTNALLSTFALTNEATYYAVNIENGCASSPFEVTVNVVLGTPVFANSSIVIFPNPTSSILNFQTQNNIQIDKIIISDLTGKKVLEQNNANQVNVANLAQGLYVVEALYSEYKWVSKFIKE